MHKSSLQIDTKTNWPSITSVISLSAIATSEPVGVAQRSQPDLRHMICFSMLKSSSESEPRRKSAAEFEIKELHSYQFPFIRRQGRNFGGLRVKLSPARTSSHQNVALKVKQRNVWFGWPDCESNTVSTFYALCTNENLQVLCPN